MSNRLFMYEDEQSYEVKRKLTVTSQFQLLYVLEKNRVPPILGSFLNLR